MQLSPAQIEGLPPEQKAQVLALQQQMVRYCCFYIVRYFAPVLQIVWHVNILSCIDCGFNTTFPWESLCERISK